MKMSDIWRLFLRSENGEEFRLRINELKSSPDFNINCPDENNATILHFATSFSENSLDKIKVLLEMGADVNHKSNTGYTALFFATDIDIAKLLLDNNAKWDIKGEHNNTPASYIRTMAMISLDSTLSPRKTENTDTLLKVADFIESYGKELELKHMDKTSKTNDICI